MVGRLIVAILLALTPGVITGRAEPVQSAGEPYDDLSSAQRAVLPGDAAQGRDEYNRAPAPFREAFAAITARLTSLLLSDPENGEVLGSALDLIEQIDAPAAQPIAGPGAVRLTVTLSAGARDRLRRSREFVRVAQNGRVVFVHDQPPQVRIELDEAARATVALMRP